MKTKKVLLSAAVSALTIAGSQMATAADTITEALTEGKGYVDTRLRYETVSQDNALEDASALTLRTFVGYKTGNLNGFSAHVEMEDARVVMGIDDYNAAGLNGKPEYSVIADPEHTELDQGYIMYKNDVISGKLGRQVLTLDNHRFVGHVGWRQDRQTFDALSVDVTPTKDLSFKLAYLDQRNRIFGEARDIDSEDLLVNASYKTPIGALKGYTYFLDVEDVDNAENDTMGVSFAPKFGDLSIYAEFATQETANNEADYMNLEAGYKAGKVTLKAGYEVLGSDDGEYGFSTPLATLHKFNGWADQFLGTPAVGLTDFTVGAIAKVGPGTLKGFYHTFESDEGDVDFGSELDLVYALKFGKIYNAGVKAAFYAAGDDDSGKVDTDKLWLWVGAKF